MPVDPVMVFLDLEKADTIFINLLSNAMKFTDPGGRITVFVEHHHEAGGLERILPTVPLSLGSLIPAWE